MVYFLFSLETGERTANLIKARFGLDRCKYMLVGADSMDLTTLKYFWECNIKVLEVYGLTETTGPHSTNLNSKEKYGHCGSSINGVQTKIIKTSEYSESKVIHLSKPRNEIGEVN